MDGFKSFENKAAGHNGTLTDNDGLLVFKPLNEQERQFYQQIQTRNQDYDNDDDEEDIPLQTWMPTFLGVLNEGKSDTTNNLEHMIVIPDDSNMHLNTIENATNSDLKGKNYLVLENLLTGFNKPNIMDIKLGKILYDENASKEKIERMKQVSKDTTSGSLGFRICGMQLQKNHNHKFDPNHIEDRFDSDSNTEYISVNKLFGRTRTVNNISEAIEIFFDNENLSIERKMILKDMFLTRLQLFYNTLLNEEVRMISSSLLFIFEGDEKRWNLKNDQDDVLNNVLIEDDSDDEGKADDDEEAKQKNAQKYPLSSMTLIDFAHSKLTPGQGYDENVIEGVESLIDIFMNISKKQ
ncbi:inositol polyphosphate multikinase [Monosporozyma servazzii]